MNGFVPSRENIEKAGNYFLEAASWKLQLPSEEEHTSEAALIRAHI